jgi:hypothetical protein
MANNPVLDGIIQGINMGLLMRREQAQQEAFRQQQARLKREEELRDFDMQSKLARMGAKPVDDMGMVSEPMRYEGQAIPGMIGAEAIPAGAMIGEKLRKGKAGQVVKYKTRDGRILAYELPTEEEQQARALELYRQRQMADDESMLERQKKYFDYTQSEKRRMQAETPRVDVMDPQFLRNVPIDQLSSVANLRRTLTPDWKMATDYVTGTPSFVGVDPLTGQPMTVRDPGWTGAARPRPRQPVGGQLNAGGGGAREKAEEKAREQARKDLAALQKEEDNYHAEKLAIGAKLREGFPKDKNNPNKDAVQRRDAHARLVQLDALIKAKQAAKDKIIQRFGGRTASDPLGIRGAARSAGGNRDPLGILD